MNMPIIKLIDTLPAIVLIRKIVIVLSEIYSNYKIVHIIKTFF